MNGVESGINESYTFQPLLQKIFGKLLLRIKME